MNGVPCGRATERIPNQGPANRGGWLVRFSLVENDGERSYLCQALWTVVCRNALAGDFLYPCRGGFINHNWVNLVKHLVLKIVRKLVN